MKTKQLFVAFFITIVSLSCGSKDVLPPSINPSEVNILSKFITLSDGAVKSNGNLPAPDNLFSISNLNTSITSSNGSTASIVIKLSGTSANQISGYYINIEGSNIYYKVPLNEIPTNGLLTIPIGLPTVLEAGNFCVNVMTYNSQNQTSNVAQQCINVVKLGTGALQINLAWDTNYSDIDLHVIDPSGFEIYFGDDYSSATGGQLDRDDVYGFGPENIYWDSNAPDGTYKVYIHYYGDDNYYSGQRTTNYITVSGAKDSKSFVKVLTRVDEYQFITRITKNGDRLTFSTNENARENNDVQFKKYPKKH